jgi:hypothetical protein
METLMNPQTLLIVAVAVAAGVMLTIGINALLKSKTGQAVEADAETAAFSAAEKSVEWLADSSGHEKAIAAEQAKMAKKAQLLTDLRDKLAKL